MLLIDFILFDSHASDFCNKSKILCLVLNIYKEYQNYWCSIDVSIELIFHSAGSEVNCVHKSKSCTNMTHFES